MILTPYDKNKNMFSVTLWIMFQMCYMSKYYDVYVLSKKKKSTEQKSKRQMPSFYDKQNAKTGMTYKKKLFSDHVITK